MEGVTAVSKEPEDVIISRNGAVLGKKTVLKSDHFPGCQNKRLVPQVDGAPNYRQVFCACALNSCKSIPLGLLRKQVIQARLVKYL